jgi:hypothetical protein
MSRALHVGLVCAVVLVACQRDRPDVAKPTESRDPLETIAREPTGFSTQADPTRRDACGVPLAVSPEGLIRPEAIGSVQQRLVEEQLLADGGFRRGTLDAPTLDAILELQRREELPETGVPTYATIEALGLDRGEVFHAGEAECERGGR